MLVGILRDRFDAQYNGNICAYIVPYLSSLICRLDVGYNWGFEELETVVSGLYYYYQFRVVSILDAK